MKIFFDSGWNGIVALGQFDLYFLDGRDSFHILLYYLLYFIIIRRTRFVRASFVNFRHSYLIEFIGQTFLYFSPFLYYFLS